MTSASPDGPTPDGTWDGVVHALHVLRREAGDPSYAELTRRIHDQRVARGTDEHAAHVARSTVHDAFRYGRTRLNLELVHDIVGALGADPAIVRGWVQQPPPPPVQPAPAPAPPAPTPAPPTAPTAPADPVPAPVVEEPAAVLTHPVRGRDLVLVLLGCLALNLLGRLLVDTASLPLYLDMAGTGIAAVVLGPWRGALVGVATGVAGVALSGAESLSFIVVSVVGALLWGYGVRSPRVAASLPRFFGLTLLVAVACTAVAVPVLVLLYEGSVRPNEDLVTRAILRRTDAVLPALVASNLTTSVLDKLISGFVVVMAVSALPPRVAHGLAFLRPGQPVAPTRGSGSAT